MPNRVPQPPTAAAAVATRPATWNTFVERFGTTMAAGLLTAIAAWVVAYNVGLHPPEGATTVQLLLVMIMLGCMAVLSFRDGDATS
jgi:hypothetical protein